MDTPLTQLLGCRYPIVQTAMGWVADARLVAATTNAGGFGFLAAATLSTEELDAALAEVRQLCSGPFGVNFHMFQPNAQDVIERVLQHSDRVRAVSYGRGPNAETIARFKQAGVLCMPTVGALKHAHQRYTRAINAREKWTGFLWQGRFGSCAMDEGHALAAVRYVELNPVKAGLVERAQDWRWSSARFHVEGREDGLTARAAFLDRIADWPGYLAAGLAPEAEAQLGHFTAE